MYAAIVSSICIGPTAVLAVLPNRKWPTRPLWKPLAHHVGVVSITPGCPWLVSCATVSCLWCVPCLWQWRVLSVLNLICSLRCVMIPTRKIRRLRQRKFWVFGVRNPDRAQFLNNARNSHGKQRTTGDLTPEEETRHSQACAPQSRPKLRHCDSPERTFLRHSFVAVRGASGQSSLMLGGNHRSKE